MLQILPYLRYAVEQQFPNVNLSFVMIALELSVPGNSQRVVVQCIDEGQFRLTTKNSRYEVLEEIEVSSTEVVELTIQRLKKATNTL